MIKVFHLTARHANYGHHPFMATNEQVTAMFKGKDADFHHVHVATVDTDDLDQAYELTNTIHRYWPENPGVTAYAERLRSTSMGDVLSVADGTAYIVAMIGFVPIQE